MDLEKRERSVEEEEEDQRLSKAKRGMPERYSPSKWSELSAEGELVESGNSRFCVTSFLDTRCSHNFDGEL